MSWFPWASSQAAAIGSGHVGGERPDAPPLHREEPVNVDGSEEPNALLDAARKGELDTLWTLLESGEDVNTRETRLEYDDFKGFTPLLYAARMGHTDVVEELLDRQPDIEAVDAMCRATALQEASWAGHAEIVRLLLDAGANPNDDYGVTWPDNVLTRHGFVVSERDPTAPLIYASRAGSIACVEALLRDARANVDISGIGRERPLHMAAKYKHLQVAKLLVSALADVNVTDRLGQTPLHVAIANRSVDIALYLIEETTIDLEVPKPENLQRALHMAAEYELPRVIQALVRKGALVNAQLKTGHTPLHIACWSENPKSVRLLLEAGADVNAETEDNSLPIHDAFPTRKFTIYCKVPETLKIIRLLLSHGAKWDEVCDAEVDKKFRPHVGPAVRLCVKLWEAERTQGRRSLTRIPVSIVEVGEEATLTYIKELKSSKDVILRRKVCVVGPSNWGKTSLIKSFMAQRPYLVHKDARTIGVDTRTVEMIRDTAIGEEHNQVTFWDFAGHQEYFAAHSLFFSANTLFLVCIDMTAARLALQHSQLRGDDERQQTRFMDEFMDARVLRWILTILARQPDAEFEFVITKFDALEIGFALWYHGTQLDPDHPEADLLLLTRLYVLRLQAIIENLKRVFSARDRQCDERTEESEEPEAKPVSVASLADPRIPDLIYYEPKKIPAPTSCVSPVHIQLSLVELPRLIFKHDTYFAFPDKYSRVLNAIIAMRPPRGETARQEQTIVDANELIDTLCARVPDLDQPTCRIILRTLRDLGDVLWYDDIGVDNLQSKVFIDPPLMIDFVRAIINHEQLDEVVSHAVIKGLPLWSALDQDMMCAMKKLLQHFQLVYPTTGKMDWNSDLLVPALRRLKTGADWLFLRQDLRLGSQREPLAESHHVHWEYHFENWLPLTLFDHLAVESYSAFFDRRCGPDWILYGDPNNGPFACRVMVSRDSSSQHKILQLEAVLAQSATVDDAGKLWDRFELVSCSLVRVLRRFKGVIVSKVARNGTRLISLSSLFATPFPRQQPTWLPPNATWEKLKDIEQELVLDSTAAEFFAW